MTNTPDFTNAQELQRLYPGTAEIQLTKGYMTIVDMADYDWLSGWSWWALVTDWGGVYAIRQERRKNVYMHREILNAPPDLQVDHRSGDGLDNRRANLRLCTCGQNQENKQKINTKTTSMYKGVYYHIRRGYWVARLYSGGRYYYLGRFQDQEHAALAYNAAAVRYHGEFAILNEILPANSFNPNERPTA